MQKRVHVHIVNSQKRCISCSKKANIQGRLSDKKWCRIKQVKETIKSNINNVPEETSCECFITEIDICASAPCVYDCTSAGSDFMCGCPPGYEMVGQGYVWLFSPPVSHTLCSYWHSPFCRLHRFTKKTTLILVKLIYIPWLTLFILAYKVTD